MEDRRLLAGDPLNLGVVVPTDGTVADVLSDVRGVHYEDIALDEGVAAVAGLTADLPSGQPVGTTITWTVTGSGSGTEVFRFSSGRLGESLQQIYDFRENNVFEWSPIEDGSYVIAATIKEPLGYGFSDHRGRSVSDSPQPSARLTPVVTPTDNPLIALYSAPDLSPVGPYMRVVFTAPVREPSVSTGRLPNRAEAGHTTNFYIAGMRPETTYRIRHEVLDAGGNHVQFGPWRGARAGSISIPLPPTHVLNPAGVSSQKVIVHSALIGSMGLAPFPFAVDQQGEVIWYLEQEGTAIWRTLNGGRFWQRDGDFLREIDLAGNVLRETNLDQVNRQLADLGEDIGNDIHHEARPLPNGHTAILMTTEKILEDVQGTWSR